MLVNPSIIAVSQPASQVRVYSWNPQEVLILIALRTSQMTMITSGYASRNACTVRTAHGFPSPAGPNAAKATTQIHFDPQQAIDMHIVRVGLASVKKNKIK